MTKSMHLKADLAKIDELIAAISQKKERFMSYTVSLSLLLHSQKNFR